ncbi:hypothetical protein [Colwellia sp. UCD-KL20]|uniref:hypothetical protein n=1 Tax=Colwellia sp. UCD-KL20 TaxID=1917165 RepID=UPI000970239C|nr:hypothetical protein [Colwellia sp. UCD-KL20]
MINSFLILIGRLLNWLPLIHVSSDSDFGSFDGKHSGFRISLFGLSVGQFKYYYFSLIKENNTYKFEIFKKLDLTIVCNLKSENELNNKASSYVDVITEYGEDAKAKDKISYHIDLLKEKSSQSQSRISNSFTKLTNYRVFLLTMSASSVYLLSEVAKFSDFNYLVIFNYFLLILFFLFSFSSFSQVTYALKVKGYIKSKFSDLKKDTSQIQLAKSYYIDFLSLQDESQIAVSITKNAEKYFNRSFLILVLSWIIVFFTQNHLTKEQNNSLVSYTDEFVITDSSNKTNIEQLSQFFEKLNSYEGEIYIISTKSSDGVKKLSGFIETVLIEKQVLKIVTIKSKTLKDNVILLKFGD